MTITQQTIDDLAEMKRTLGSAPAWASMHRILCELVCALDSRERPPRAPAPTLGARARSARRAVDTAVAEASALGAAQPLMHALQVEGFDDWADVERLARSDRHPVAIELLCRRLPSGDAPPQETTGNVSTRLLRGWATNVAGIERKQMEGLTDEQVLGLCADRIPIEPAKGGDAPQEPSDSEPACPSCGGDRYHRTCHNCRTVYQASRPPGGAELRWWADDGEGSEECHDEAHARLTAADALTDCHNEACGDREWPDRTEAVCWGYMVEVERAAVAGIDGEGCTDYALLASEGAAPPQPDPQHDEMNRRHDSMRERVQAKLGTDAGFHIPTPEPEVRYCQEEALAAVVEPTGVPGAPGWWWGQMFSECEYVPLRVDEVGDGFEFYWPLGGTDDVDDGHVVWGGKVERCTPDADRLAGVERDRDSAAEGMAAAREELAGLRKRVDGVLATCDRLAMQTSGDTRHDYTSTAKLLRAALEVQS